MQVRNFRKSVADWLDIQPPMHRHFSRAAAACVCEKAPECATLHEALHEISEVVLRSVLKNYQASVLVWPTIKVKAKGGTRAALGCSR